MTAPETSTATRCCLYCDAEFTPTVDEQLYCRKTHQHKASRKRRNGIAPRLLPRQVLSCTWCGKPFETHNQDQRYCSPAHKANAVTCDKKQDFLSEDAAAAAVKLYPVLRGPVEAYPCPRPKGLPHWHLRNVIKRKNSRNKYKQEKRNRQRRPGGDPA